MRILLIDEKAKQEIRNLMDYAEKNPITMFDMIDDPINLKREPIGNNPNYVVHLNVGYRVVLSIEKQPVGDVRHLSVSVDADKKLPHPEAIREIMRLFGFDNDLENCVIKPETISPNRIAMNILEIIKK